MNTPRTSTLTGFGLLNLAVGILVGVVLGLILCGVGHSQVNDRPLIPGTGMLDPFSTVDRNWGSNPLSPSNPWYGGMPNHPNNPNYGGSRNPC